MSPLACLILPAHVVTLHNVAGASKIGPHVPKSAVSSLHRRNFKKDTEMVLKSVQDRAPAPVKHVNKGNTTTKARPEFVKMAPTKTLVRVRRNPPRACKAKRTRMTRTKNKIQTATKRPLKKDELTSAKAGVDPYDPLALAFASAGSDSERSVSDNSDQDWSESEGDCDPKQQQHEQEIAAVIASNESKQIHEQEVTEFIATATADEPKQHEQEVAAFIDATSSESQPQPQTHVESKGAGDGTQEPVIVVPGEWPPWTAEMQADIDAILEQPENDILARSRLRVSDLYDFDDGEWLNDRIIDYYLLLISQRNEDQEDLRPVYAFEASFVKLLHSKRYQDLELDNDNDVNIFECALIFFPIHIGNHWRLVTVDVDSKLIIAFDSIGKSNTRSLNVVENFLAKEYHRVRRDDDPSTEEYFTGWQKFNQKKQDTPQQQNSSDCGVFLLLFADYLARDKPFDFRQEHALYFRRLMTYEVIEGELLPHNMNEKIAVVAAAKIESDSESGESDTDMDANVDEIMEDMDVDADAGAEPDKNNTDNEGNEGNDDAEEELD